MSSLNEIRSEFLTYFQSNGHEIVSSSPLVPRNDPTLLFTNSGMVQFKSVFTGAEKRSYSRAVTSQKCVRAGGKHNDLDNVGYTARHHTFFEMLGNFSFGDYFKEQAIEYCWDLVTRKFGVDRNRLLATVYHEDDEAVEYWKKCAGLPDDKIIKIATSDNFWSMGPVGPCGPCTELYYDHGENIPGGPPGSPDEDGDRYTEIWNLVFMQFEQLPGGERNPLPKPSIDTGMGLERIGSVLQGKTDNYDTDLFRALIEASANATSSDPDGPYRIHHRVVADHLRSTAFLIAEGVLPSKEGRGYVLRRIMRRAMRHAQQLGASAPLLPRLVPVLVGQMGNAFPELVEARSLIEDTCFHEETRFRLALGRGLRLLDDTLNKLPSNSPLPGEIAFKLYDTFGFPLDLTQDALRERGRDVDVQGFEKAMREQRERARAAWKGIGDSFEDKTWFDLADEFGATEFLGYRTCRAEGQILAIVKDGKRTNRAAANERISIVVNQSPFYAEAGGQVGDTGTIETETGLAEVFGTHSHAGVHVHDSRIVRGEIIVGAAGQLSVDSARRKKIQANHSGTHLLHESLRTNLGTHVAQRGSLNAEDRLRFDFAHSTAMSLDEIIAVETDVNAQISKDSVVETRIMTPEQAIHTGARALFGEKYGDEIRVVSMGISDDGNQSGEAKPYSVEICGGTHVRHTGEIGLFVITGEAASAAGIRRIEALTGETARLHLSEQDRRLAQVALLLKARGDDIVTQVGNLINERKELAADVQRLGSELAIERNRTRAADTNYEEINGFKFSAQVLDSVSAKQLPALIDDRKSQMRSGIVVLISDLGDKAPVAVGVTDDLVSKVSAVDIIKVALPHIGGRGGGGRPDFARGGGTDPKSGQISIKAVRQYLGELK